MADGQRRAKAGGEFGANGEWYEGGKFIATTDHVKLPPVKWEPSLAATAEALAREERSRRWTAAYDAWMAARAEVNASAIAFLLAQQPQGVYFEQFLPSLGRQLRDEGSLSRKQAQYAAKGILGRYTNKTAESHEALIEQFTETFTFNEG